MEMLNLETNKGNDTSAHHSYSNNFQKRRSMLLIKIKCYYTWQASSNLQITKLHEIKQNESLWPFHCYIPKKIKVAINRLHHLQLLNEQKRPTIFPFIHSPIDNQTKSNGMPKIQRDQRKGLPTDQVYI